MNDPLPKVPFSKKGRAEIGFEIFPISSLFSRHAQIKPPIDKPHRVQFYQVLYITRGSGVHHIDFKPCRFKTGSLIFTSRGQVQAFDVQPDVDGFILLFTDSFLSRNLIHSDILSYYRLYNYHLHEPVVQPEETGGESFKKFIEEIYWEYLLANEFAKEDILRLLLKLLLLKVERIKRTLEPKEKNSEWLACFNTFKNLLETHFADTRNAKDYAGMMGISYKHMNEVCKSITGQTAKAFIDQFLILEAKRQLAVSGISAKELTYDLGFDEPTNFLKFFKKHTGVSPTTFKAELKK